MSNINAEHKLFSVDTFETLLQQRESHSKIPLKMYKTQPQEQPRLQSSKNATLHDFIEMISKIITKATRERNIIFEPDEGVRPKVDQSIPFDEAHIYYEVISRRPCLEIKPREREEIFEADSLGRVRSGRVWGQRFECVIQLHIFAGDYVTADKTMDIVEDIMFNYASYFKKNGVAEIVFMDQITDHNYDIYRQGMSIRTLRYRVWIEKLYTAFDAAEIDGIITQ